VVLRTRVQVAAPEPALLVLCAGFELQRWRGKEFADDIFDRHLLSFALKYSELGSVSGETASKALRQAASIVYNTDKYGSRGEFGELILHGVLRDFFGALPAVSKIFYKDSANDTVKGFDAVHLVEAEGTLELWLGEVKFYKDVRAAVRDAATEIELHLASDFLRAEFIAITNKLDTDWPQTNAVRELLDTATSLDEIASSLVIPVLLTYESPAVLDFDVSSDEYIRRLEDEAAEAWNYFVERLTLPLPVTLHLILIPLESKESFVALMHDKLRLWQAI
jgi:hypothetical protein